MLGRLGLPITLHSFCETWAGTEYREIFARQHDKLVTIDLHLPRGALQELVTAGAELALSRALEPVAAAAEEAGAWLFLLDTLRTDDLVPCWRGDVPWQDEAMIVAGRVLEWFEQRVCAERIWLSEAYMDRCFTQADHGELWGRASVVPLGAGVLVG